MIPSLRPAGSRLIRTSNVKLRCVNLNDNQNYWDSFWGVNWSQSDLLQQIAYYASIGVNCLKIYCDGIASSYAGGNGPNYGTGYPSDAVMVQRIQWFLQQMRANNMRVYLSMNQSIDFVGATQATTIANIATEQKYLRWFAQYGADVVVALDLCNEMNGGGTHNYWGTNPTYGTTSNANAYRDMSLLAQMARATVPFPLTASVFVSGGRNGFGSNGWLDLQYDLGLDFHDYHPYYVFSPITSLSQCPAASDLAVLEGRAKFIGRHFIGECGEGPDSISGQVPGAQAAWVSGMGDHARTARSFGAVYFMSRPYAEGPTAQSVSYSQYGILDQNLSNPNQSIVAPLQRWPASV